MSWPAHVLLKFSGLLSVCKEKCSLNAVTEVARVGFFQEAVNVDFGNNIRVDIVSVIEIK